MKIRGRRECKSCGRRWSYYETAEVSCPDCGSVQSVGLDDDRSLHTAGSASLDLAPVRGRVDAEPTRRIAELAADRCGSFVREHGFVDAGELLALEDTYLAAVECRHVGRELSRRHSTTPDEEWYLTLLLRADEGRRPSPDDVPSSLRGQRGLACADAVERYRSDLRTYLSEHPDDAATGPLETLGTHVRRLQALEGDVPPRESETLVAAARDVGRYLTDGDDGALAAAENRLSRLD